MAAMARTIIRNRRRLSWSLVLAVSAVLTPLVLVAHVAVATRPYRYEHLSQVPACRVAVVFGAGVRNGTPSPMLADRIMAGVRLYQNGQVQKILMTGDNGQVNYDEVTVMKRYAVAHGVPAEDITLDYAGFRTYDSCYRARDIFGVTESAVLVTQRYHLPRAVYTCRHLGIDAVGLGLPDWEVYPRVMTKYSIREVLATLKALSELYLTHPLPRFLGPFEGIS